MSYNSCLSKKENKINNIMEGDCVSSLQDFVAKRGCNVFSKRLGGSLLHLAMMYDAKKCAAFLLQCPDIDIEVRSFMGLTLIEAANKFDSHWFIELFEQHFPSDI